MSETIWQGVVVLLVVAVVIEAVVITGALRELGSLLMQIGPARYGEVGEGPQPGDDAGVGLPADVPTIAVFLGPTCDYCKPIAAALPRVRADYPDLYWLPIVIGDDSSLKRSYAASLGPEARTDLDSLFSRWGIPGTPFGVGIGTDGRIITSGVVNTLPQLEDLAATILAATAHHEEHLKSGGDEVPRLDLVQIGPMSNTEGG